MHHLLEQKECNDRRKERGITVINLCFKKIHHPRWHDSSSLETPNERNIMPRAPYNRIKRPWRRRANANGQAFVGFAVVILLCRRSRLNPFFSLSEDLHGLVGLVVVWILVSFILLHTKRQYQSHRRHFWALSSRLNQLFPLISTCVVGRFCVCVLVTPTQTLLHFVSTLFHKSTNIHNDSTYCSQSLLQFGPCWKRIREKDTELCHVRCWNLSFLFRLLLLLFLKDTFGFWSVCTSIRAPKFASTNLSKFHPSFSTETFMKIQPKITKKYYLMALASILYDSFLNLLLGCVMVIAQTFCLETVSFCCFATPFWYQSSILLLDWKPYENVSKNHRILLCDGWSVRIMCWSQELGTLRCHGDNSNIWVFFPTYFVVSLEAFVVSQSHFVVSLESFVVWVILLVVNPRVNPKFHDTAIGWWIDFQKTYFDCTSTGGISLNFF